MTSILFAPRSGTKGPELMTVHIRESKTDPFRLGYTITVGATNSDICPVQALQNYLSLPAPPPPPTRVVLRLFMNPENLLQNKF